MKNDFQIISSSKHGINSRESYVIAREKIGFLRVLGDEPEWSLITATASEDHGQIHVCSDQRRLIETALRLGAEIGTSPKVKQDWLGREYVEICVITREPGESEEVFDRENTCLLKKFFEIFDGLNGATFQSADELCALYGALSIDDQGDDIYLSDGVWLSSDGSMRDQSR